MYTLKTILPSTSTQTQKRDFTTHVQNNVRYYTTTTVTYFLSIYTHRYELCMCMYMYLYIFKSTRKIYTNLMTVAAL